MTLELPACLVEFLSINLGEDDRGRDAIIKLLQRKFLVNLTLKDSLANSLTARNEVKRVMSDDFKKM